MWESVLTEPASLPVQATIKLYVLTAMFEILDKLMISFGQDTLDSLYWSAKKNSDRK
jgi:hypothetical protein